MARGFHGHTPLLFMSAVNGLIGHAADVHSRNPFENLRQGTVAHPRLMPVQNRRPPFDDAEMHEAVFRTGVGNSSNIVVNGGLYSEITHRLANIDYEAGYRLHGVIVAIERMCAETYVVPETAAAITETTSRLKQLMGYFSGAADEAVTLARRYVEEMAQVDTAGQA